MVAEPKRPLSQIRGDRSISFLSITGLIVIGTFHLIQGFIKGVRVKQEKEKKEEEFSFFVPAYVLIRGIEIGDYLVATESCTVLNNELKLNPKIEQFMVGEVVGVIGETVFQFTIRVFPKKRFVYTTGMYARSACFLFLLKKSIKNKSCPTWRRSD